MVWARYLRYLEKYPLRAWALQTGAMMTIGDLASQVIVERREWSEINQKRVMRFAVFGLFYVGPVVRVWYLFLDKIIRKTGPAAALKKVVLDQAIFAPLFVGNFIILMGAIQRQPWERVEERLRSDYYDILKANWMVWPFVQTVNFYFVPLQHRIQLVNATALIWNASAGWICSKPCVDCNMTRKGTGHFYFEDCFQLSPLPESGSGLSWSMLNICGSKPKCPQPPRIVCVDAEPMTCCKKDDNPYKDCPKVQPQPPEKDCKPKIEPKYECAKCPPPVIPCHVEEVKPCSVKPCPCRKKVEPRPCPPVPCEPPPPVRKPCKPPPPPCPPPVQKLCKPPPPSCPKPPPPCPKPPPPPCPKPKPQIICPPCPPKKVEPPASCDDNKKTCDENSWMNCLGKNLMSYHRD